MDVSLPNDTGSSNGHNGTYVKVYKGDGSVSGSGWPSKKEWLTYEQLWELNAPNMKHACGGLYGSTVADNSDLEIEDIKAAVEEVSSQTGVDKAFITASMLQESNGCVRVKTTSFSHANPGLFQSHAGNGSCNDGSSKPREPCPRSEIYQMVLDGVNGTSSGDGLKQCFANAAGDGAERYYRAARMYNSGSLGPSGDLGLRGSTPCYCSDIANRLLGWSQGTSSCSSHELGA
jgi:hypothetical protein